MSTAPNITFKKIKDSTQSASVIQDSVHTDNLQRAFKSNTTLLDGLNSSAPSTPTITSTQLREASLTQVVVDDNGDFAIDLLIDGESSASNAAAAALQAALGLATVGDAGLLHIQRNAATNYMALNGTIISPTGAGNVLALVAVQATNVTAGAETNTIVAIN